MASHNQNLSFTDLSQNSHIQAAMPRNNTKKSPKTRSPHRQILPQNSTPEVNTQNDTASAAPHSQQNTQNNAENAAQKLPIKIRQINLHKAKTAHANLCYQICKPRQQNDNGLFASQIYLIQEPYQVKGRIPALHTRNRLHHQSN